MIFHQNRIHYHFLILDTILAKYNPKTVLDVLRILDEIFSCYNIYPPKMVETEPGKYAGDVSKNEWIWFKWNETGFVGICYDGHTYENLDALFANVSQIHNEFVSYSGDVIIPDRIIIISD
jgi:hypothetical protein